jgi:hypothetical protein
MNNIHKYRTLYNTSRNYCCIGLYYIIYYLNETFVVNLNFVSTYTQGKRETDRDRVRES